MVSVGLYDTLEFQRTSEPTLSLEAIGPVAKNSHFPTGPENLIAQAAERLRAGTGTPCGAIIRVRKRIPSEAGMGGGSSDAAATLVALNRLWELNCSRDRLHQIAAELGSDLNFFLDSNIAALCTGRGEAIRPVPVSRKLHFVIIKPNCGLPTGTVFKTWGTLEEPTTNTTDSLTAALKIGHLQQLSQSVKNSLEQAARHLRTEIDETLTALRNQNVIASGMTGSGSACFGICQSRHHARAIAARLRSSRKEQVWAVSSGL